MKIQGTKKYRLTILMLASDVRLGVFCTNSLFSARRLLPTRHFLRASFNKLACFLCHITPRVAPRVDVPHATRTTPPFRGVVGVAARVGGR